MPTEETPKQTKSWHDILRFLETGGYDLQQVRATETREADLLFICTDVYESKDEDVKYLVDSIWQGFLGLAVNQEILISIPVHRHVSPYYGSTSHPMMVSSDFTAYGIGMIHTYIRTMHDKGAKAGRYLSMMLQLEDILRQHGVVHADEDVAAYRKIEKFKSLLKRRGHGGGEARWVFATLDLLRHARNLLSHAPPPPNAKRGFQKAVDEINGLATEYGRALGSPPKSDIQDPYSGQKKWITSLAQTASLWVDKYLEDNPV